MRQIGSLENQKFGKLTVKRLVGKDKYYDKLWECECECGNLVTVKQGHLRSGHTTSCGCNKFLLNDLTGKRFGYLTVQERDDDYICPENNKHYVRWKCVCDCGKTVSVIIGNLKNHGTLSCGCKDPHRLDDLTGRTYGKLTVSQLVDSYINPSGRKLIRYKCRCTCGNEIYALANTLRTGDVMSCGCSVNSKGEHMVTDWLNDHGYVYETHKSFADCLSDAGHRLNFDFYLPIEQVLIECNGIQHYEAIDFFGGMDRFIVQTKYDDIKKQYAETKGIRYLVLDCRKKNLKAIPELLNDFFYQS